MHDKACCFLSASKAFNFVILLKMTKLNLQMTTLSYTMKLREKVKKDVIENQMRKSKCGNLIIQKNGKNC